MAAVLEKAVPAREFALSLRVDESINRNLAEGLTLVEIAEACTVDSLDMAVVAKENLDGCIRFRTTLDEQRKKFIEPAKKIIDEANGLFKPAIEAAQRAELIYRKRLTDWQIAEQRRIEDARRRQAEEERRIREQAEREAAAARARAEQAAAEARRKADEEEKARKVAEAEGNARAAREAAARKAKLEEEARQREEAAERAAEQARLEAAARMPTTVVPEQQKVAGLTMRDNWICEPDPRLVDSGDGSEKRCMLELVLAIAGVKEPQPGARLDLIGCVMLNDSAADKLTKALKNDTNIPGYRAVNRQVPVNRKTK